VSAAGSKLFCEQLAKNYRQAGNSTMFARELNEDCIIAPFHEDERAWHAQVIYAANHARANEYARTRDSSSHV